MSSARSPGKRALPREVLKWLQGLELSFYPKNVRRDFSDGYLVAEIFSHYHPQGFLMHSYDKGTSLSAKQRNWSQIKRSLQKQNLDLTKEATDGTIHCKPGAAELLVQEMYTILTNRSLRDVPGPDSNFTDQEHRGFLPTLAKPTDIKKNRRLAEVMAGPDTHHRNLEQKATERVLHSEMSSTWSGTAVSFKEIKVRQPVRRSLVE